MRYKKHIVQKGDTIQYIAQLYYNDTSVWVELIDFNDLKYPYIVDTPEQKKENLEHLVTYGDTIIIPQESELGNSNLYKINNKDKERLNEISLGMDIDILSGDTYYQKHGTSDELVGMSEDNEYKDLRVATGLDNIKQMLITRLLTARGSIMLHPDYGSDLHLMFGKATPDQELMIETEIIRCLNSDGRVVSVNKISSDINQNEYVGSFEVNIESVEDSLRFILNADQTGVFARFE